jgi:hypothetical protein
MARLHRVLLVCGLVAGCAADDGIEDPIDDDFTTEGKADAMGIEDWSPDGKAVLALVNQTGTASDLVEQASLTSSVAKRIVDWKKGDDRRAGTADDREFEDLRQLDKIPYVGKRVFKALREAAFEQGLYRTSIRMPLLMSAGDDPSQLASVNERMREHGLQPFGRYAYVDGRSDVFGLVARYQERLDALIALEPELEDFSVFTGLTVSSYKADGLKPCYIGAAAQVPDLVNDLADGLVSDQYTVWAYRWHDQQFVDDVDVEDDVNDAYDAAWADYDEKSWDVLIINSTSDGGDERDADLIPPCR